MSICMLATEKTLHEKVISIVEVERNASQVKLRIVIGPVPQSFQTNEEPDKGKSTLRKQGVPYS